MNTTQHPAVIWLRDELLPLSGSLAAAARQTGISHKTLKGLIEDNYQGNTEQQLAKLEQQRERLTLTAPRAAIVDKQYIPTGLMARIHRAADAAKAAGLINTIVGKSQIGKTTAARAYALIYPDSTIYYRMPTRPTMSSFLRGLCESAGIAKHYTTAAAAMSNLRAHLSTKHLLIVDEAHAALMRRTGLDAMDIIRELHDTTGCAVLLIVTDIGVKLIDSGAAADRLIQLVRRGERDTLEPTPSVDDIIAIVYAYGLPEPTQEQQMLIFAMARSTCFGQICHRLKLAADDAARAGESISWAHFKAAHDRLSNAYKNQI